MDNSRELFHSTYNIDASNGNVSYTCHTCNCTMSIFRANRHMQSMRHLKCVDKGKCYVNLTQFYIIQKFA